MQLGEFTNFLGVTSKSDNIFAVESRFYVHYQSHCEDTVMKIYLYIDILGSEENNQLRKSYLLVGFSGDFLLRYLILPNLQEYFFKR